jgi:N-acetylneuraminic acid mutarotase
VVCLLDEKPLSDGSDKNEKNYVKGSGFSQLLGDYSFNKGAIVYEVSTNPYTNPNLNPNLNPNPNPNPNPDTYL